MATHDDYDSNQGLAAIRKQFEDLAEQMTRRGENLITAGAANETALWEERRLGVLIRRLPKDPLALRISIGEAREKGLGESAYCVMRGDTKAVVNLLRRVFAAVASLPWVR